MNKEALKRKGHWKESANKWNNLPHRIWKKKQCFFNILDKIDAQTDQQRNSFNRLRGRVWREGWWIVWGKVEFRGRWILGVGWGGALGVRIVCFWLWSVQKKKNENEPPVWQVCMFMHSSLTLRTKMDAYKLAVSYMGQFSLKLKPTHSFISQQLWWKQMRAQWNTNLVT